MERQSLQERIEILEGEHLKTAAEFGLHALARFRFNEMAFDLLRGGERVKDSRLNVTMAGISFENPVMVGAGWDKKGWAVDGLYALGFSGVEVGSVLAFGQYGNPRPRLWYEDGVGRNCLGFNAPGEEKVYYNLASQQRPGVTGISLGKNKILPVEYAPWAHAEVAQKLHEFADYFVINVASPNTPDLRDLLKPKPLAENIRAVKAATDALGHKPLFVKTTVDLALEDLDMVLEVCISEGVDGVIDSNTSIDETIKARYGWQGQPGGVSGADPDYRRKCVDRMKHITRTTRGTGLQRIGVGAINDADSAIERMEAGAQIVQVVTGIRQRKGRIAREINLGLIEKVDNEGLRNISDIVGVAA
jgi:dihydroorotate dehydrogenase